MAKAAGRTLLLKLGDGADPEVFTTVAAMRSNSITINNSLPDATTKGDAGVRQLLPGAGVTSVQITGSGLFDDSANQDTLMDNALARTAANYQIEDTANSVVFEGEFAISDLQVSGDEGDLTQFSITLESTGAVSITNS
jgi:TP901-1 family phage major tail protein